MSEHRDLSDEELDAILAKLDAIDRRLTPEYLAKRYAELMDTVNDDPEGTR